MSPSERNPRFVLFDSLRAIAALAVFGLHLPFIRLLGFDHIGSSFLFALDAGVAIFFLVSGFLLYRPFAQARFERRAGPAIGPYAKRRFLRIAPAYWIALPIVVLLIGPSGQGGPFAQPVFSAEGVPAYFGFLQVYSSDTLLGGISAAWSVCVEVSFYAMLPLWALLMRRVPCDSQRSFLRTEVAGLALLFAVGLLWSSIAAGNVRVSPAAFIDVTQIEPWLYVLPAYLDHFALGMGLAVLSVWSAERECQPAWVGFVDRRPWVPWLGAGAAFVAIGLITDVFRNDFVVVFVSTHQLQGLLALGLLLPAVFGDPRRGLVRRVLGNRALLWVGLVSYGLYLWHVAVIVKLVDWGVLDALGAIPFMFVALAASLGVAALSFYVVERRALRLGRRRGSQDAEVRMQDLATHERPETAR